MTVKFYELINDVKFHMFSVDENGKKGKRKKYTLGDVIETHGIISDENWKDVTNEHVKGIVQESKVTDDELDDYPFKAVQRGKSKWFDVLDVKSEENINEKALVKDEADILCDQMILKSLEEDDEEETPDGSDTEKTDETDDSKSPETEGEGVSAESEEGQADEAGQPPGNETPTKEDSSKGKRKAI